MTDPSTRLLRLLGLLQSPRLRSGSELAELLDVDPRTVRRDIDKLRALDYPIETEPGVSGYRLGRGGNLPPLLLDDDEAVAVAVGLSTAVSSGVAGIAESSAQALTKLTQVLPSRLRHRVTTLTSAMQSIRHPVAQIDPETLTEISSAIGRHERLRFDYRSSSGSGSRREVEAYRLIHSGRTWYLFAFDPAHDDWRTFRVDRLRVRSPNGPRFVPRDLPADDLSRSTGLAISSAPYRYQAVVVLATSVERAAEHFPSTVGVLDPIDSDRCRLTAGSNSLDEILGYVATAGVDFDVVSPPELIAHLDVLISRLQRTARPHTANVGGT